MSLCAISWFYGLSVEAAVIANHEAAMLAWRSGKLPTADPPSSPIYIMEGTA